MIHKKINTIYSKLNITKNTYEITDINLTSVMLTIHSTNTFKQTNVRNQRINCIHYT